MFHCTMLRSFLVVTLLTIACGQAAFAQTDEEKNEAALKEAHTKLKEVLDKTNDLFYKEATGDDGNPFYQLIWESDGETSKIYVELRQLGHYAGKPVFSVMVYTMVASVEGSLPPTVIKAVATKNDRTMLGYFSMPESFDSVYMNCRVPSDTLAPGQLWMMMAYMHEYRTDFKKEIEGLISR